MVNTYKSYKVESIYHIIEVGINLVPFWFRGHSLCFNQLTPAIFRMENVFKNGFSAGGLEFEYMEEYQRRVLMFAGQIPEKQDFISWLFLMQHYGMPTRLLDWTENVLVAAYFAVSPSSDRDKDGEMWAMFPQRLNKIYCGSEGFPLYNSAPINYLAGQPLHKDPEKLAKNLNLIKMPETPLAFYPPLNNPRMVAQNSVFTIHPPEKSDKSNTIIKLLDNQEIFELVHYIIPAKCKEDIRKDLNKLGINRVRLFPEQDSVASDIRKYWQPRVSSEISSVVVPECGGLVEDCNGMK